MGKRMHLAILFLGAGVLSAPTVYASEGPNARIQEVFFEAQYSNAANHALSSILKNDQTHNCNFFGYKFKCVSRNLTKSEWLKLERIAMRAAPHAAKALLKEGDGPPSNRLSIVNAWKGPDEPAFKDDAKPILMLPPYPGFVPFAAYDGILNPNYEKLNLDVGYLDDVPENLAPEVDKLADDVIYGHGIFDADINGLKDLLLTADDSLFARLLHHSFDYRGHDFFGDFAAVETVADGQRIAKFWEEYAQFSDRTDLTNCSDSCSIAVTLTSKRGHIRSVAACTVTSVRSVPGGPENCYTVLTTDGKSTYIRASIYTNSVEGLDGIGGDELLCQAKGENRDIDKLASEVVANLQLINGGDTDPSYGVDVGKKGDSRTVLMTNRFGPSKLLTENKVLYEISTTRIDLYPQDNTIEASIAISASVSPTHSYSQADYMTVADEPADRMRKRVIKLLDGSLACKVVRGN
jgi:hypothetical protein